MMRAWLPLAVAVVLNASANIPMKVGARTSRTLGEDASFMARALNFFNVATVIGICLFAANVLAYRRALDRLPISVAYPVMVSVGLIFITLAAVFLPVLSERVSLVQIAGMVLIAVGVWLVASGT
jgi:multidrug transporter EmrE-like cation transporter